MRGAVGLFEEARLLGCETAALGIVVVALVWEFLGIGISVSQGGRVPYLQQNVAEAATSQLSIAFGAVMLVLLLVFYYLAGERIPELIRGETSSASATVDD